MRRRSFKIIAAACLLIAAAVITAIVMVSFASREGEGPSELAVSPVEHRREAKLADNSPEVAATLPLFHRLNQYYIRGAQPLRGGVSALARLGVKTIVDLRSQYDYTDEIRLAAERQGLGYHQLPMSVWNPPTHEEANRFVELVSDESAGPFFVFCADGLNRVGEMSAIYRVMNDGWSLEQALKEMDELGFNPYYYTLRNYVYTYTRTFRPAAIPPGARRLSPIEKWEGSANKKKS